MPISVCMAVYNGEKFLKEQRGDTNIVSLIILVGVVIIAVAIFKPYIGELANWLIGLFK